MSVTVDSDFARFGAKSYAINKITSVEVREKSPHSMGCAVVLFLCAAVSGLLFVTSVGDAPGTIGFFAVCVLLFGGLGYWQRKRAQKIEYQLFLITTASEAQAFATNDQFEVQDLRNRIEAAMSRRE